MIRLGHDLLRRQRSFGDRLEEAPDDRQQFRGLEIADHDERGVVRDIVGVVVPLEVRPRHRVQIREPTDDRPVIGMHLEGLGEEGFGQVRLWIVFGAQSPLLLHHFALELEFLVVQQQAAQPVRFQFEGQLDLVGREVFEIGREILAGEGVVVAAVFFDEARELALGVLRRALEHHVLEHVGEPGAAHHLVARADLVPDLHRDDRRLGGFDQQHFHAVGEPVFLDLQREGGRASVQE
jgi:hypothetical protein